VNFRDFPLRRIHTGVVLAPVVLASGHSPRSYASVDGGKGLGLEFKSEGRTLNSPLTCELAEDQVQSLDLLVDGFPP
jgi:hypothetical protein